MKKPVQDMRAEKRKPKLRELEMKNLETGNSKASLTNRI